MLPLVSAEWLGAVSAAAVGGFGLGYRTAADHHRRQARRAFRAHLCRWVALSDTILKWLEETPVPTHRLRDLELELRRALEAADQPLSAGQAGNSPAAVPQYAPAVPASTNSAAAHTIPDTGSSAIAE